MSARKVLVVDDEACLADLVAHTLGKCGYTVLTAEDGEQGYELTCRELPDLVVADYGMPHFDGLQMAALLKESATRDFVADAFAHCKFIGYVEAAKPLFDKVGIADSLDEGVIAIDGKGGAGKFVAALADLRLWAREPNVKMT